MKRWSLHNIWWVGLTVLAVPFNTMADTILDLSLLNLINISISTPNTKQLYYQGIVTRTSSRASLTQTQHNRGDNYTYPETISATFDQSTITAHPNAIAGWVVRFPSTYISQETPYGQVVSKSTSDAFGYIVHLDGLPVIQNSFLSSDIPLSQLAGSTLNKTIRLQIVEKVPLEIVSGTTWNNKPYNLGAAWANYDSSFTFDMIPAYRELDGSLSTMAGIKINLPKFVDVGYLQQMKDNAGNILWSSDKSYLSLCYSLTAPTGTIVLPSTTKNDFNSNGDSAVSASFSLSVNNCYATTDQGTPWTNQISAIYVTFKDNTNTSNTSNILTNSAENTTGGAKGVGFRIYPTDGNGQAVRYTPTGEIYGSPTTDFGGYKANNQAIPMDYTVNGIVGTATKSFKVHYAKQPGQIITPGTVQGSVTFTLNYQ